MKMLPLFAAAAGLTLLGASPPPMLDGPPGAGAPRGYPPCSRAVRDRCIQLYERGVANPENLALNERLGQGRLSRRYARMVRMRGSMMAGMPPMGRPMGPPMAPPMADGMGSSRRIVVASSDYRHCRGPVDDRCVQARVEAPAPAPRVWRHYEREMVRIGERG